MRTGSMQGAIFNARQSDQCEPVKCQAPCSMRTGSMVRRVSSMLMPCTVNSELCVFSSPVAAINAKVVPCQCECFVLSMLACHQCRRCALSILRCVPSMLVPCAVNAELCVFNAPECLPSMLRLCCVSAHAVCCPCWPTVNANAVRCQCYTVCHQC